MITVRMNFGEELNKEFARLSAGDKKEFIVNNSDSLEIIYACEDDFYILSREDVEATLEDIYKGQEAYDFFKKESNLDGLMDYLSRKFEIDYQGYLEHYIDSFYQDNK